MTPPPGAAAPVINRSADRAAKLQALTEKFDNLSDDKFQDAELVVGHPLVDRALGAVKDCLNSAAKSVSKNGGLRTVATLCIIFAVVIGLCLSVDALRSVVAAVTTDLWYSVMIALLVVGGVLFTVSEREALRGVGPWALTIGIYLGASAIVLSDASSGIFPTVQAKAQAFGVLSVALLIAIAVLTLRASRVAPSSGSVPTPAPTPASMSDLLSVKTSSGSTVLLLWTAVIVYALAVIGGTAIIASVTGTAPEFECGTSKTYCVPAGVWVDYLILLGVPGAAAAAAKLQKHSDEGMAATDIGTTNAVNEIQYLVFNAFAMLYVLSSVVNNGTLPAIPDLVLALTGASALVYTVNRTVQKPGQKAE